MDVSLSAPERRAYGEVRVATVQALGSAVSGGDKGAAGRARMLAFQTLTRLASKWLALAWS